MSVFFFGFSSQDFLESTSFKSRQPASSETDTKSTMYHSKSFGSQLDRIIIIIKIDFIATFKCILYAIIVTAIRNNHKRTIRFIGRCFTVELFTCTGSKVKRNRNHYHTINMNHDRKFSDTIRENMKFQPFGIIIRFADIDQS